MRTTLRELRMVANKSLSETAEVLGVEIQTVCRYEQGTRRINIEQVFPLAKLYDCSAEEVIEAQLNSCQSYKVNNRR